MTPVAPTNDAAAPPEESDWERRHYIEKVARALRHGAGLESADDVEALLRLSPERIVDHFMDDPRSLDTILDFNLYFLGLKRGALRGTDGELDHNALISRRAIHAALEFERGGNYLSLLSLNQPFYAAGPRFPSPSGAPNADAGVPTPSASERIRRERDVGVKYADDLLVRIEKAKNITELCNHLLFSEEPEGSSAFLFPGDIFPYRAGNSGTELSPLFPILLCTGGFPVDLAEVVRTARKALIGIYDFEQGLLEKSPHLDNLHDLTEVDAAQLGVPEAAGGLDSEAFWSILLNSSTNKNRRRAAYVLDRFFCDDLKPINAALPETHVGNRHASDPGCAACHYKLDPMAGFFKANGFAGLDMRRYKSIAFDDQAILDRGTYEASWATAGGWNIGYVRSSTDPSLNGYGESLDDLFHIIESAPEVKTCLVRRTFEYFNGDQQLVDPGYLAQLSALFVDEAKSNSSTAFRNVIRRVLTGRTFRASQPRSDECYDLPPGVDSASRPPCPVAFILQKNCSTCHSGPGAQSGLDLTGWLSDQQAFPHRGPDGSQRAPKDTFARMLDRVKTSDPARRMPAGRSMPASERETLYMWLEGRLGDSR
ncbi:hypothetical protein LVJ94_39680 [Pendulispora rubella]|uniref:Cytochrome c domain-containing protein n=1 Tax=Pendulispora rubella TaxID=2741070 RepID=A0ABZ2KX02_9BACT